MHTFFGDRTDLDGEPVWPMPAILGTRFKRGPTVARRAGDLGKSDGPVRSGDPRNVQWRLAFRQARCLLFVACLPLSDFIAIPDNYWTAR